MKKRKVVTLILLISCLVCWACTRRSLISHYSETIMDSAIVLGNRNMPDKAFQLVESHYASFPDISVADRYRYYRFCYDLYDSYYSKAYDPSRALSYADSMILLLQQHNLTGVLSRDYAMAYNLQGQIFVEQRRYTEAFQAFGLCRMLAEKAGDSCLVAEYNATMGTVRFRKGQYLEAAGLYKLALTEYNGCKADATEYHDVQGCFANAGLAYTRAGLTDSALAYYRKAEQYITGYKYQYTTDTLFPQIAMAVVYGNEALALETTGDYRQAETLLTKSMDINSRPGFDNKSAIVDKVRLAGLYLQLHRYDEACRFLQQTADRLPSDETTKKLWLSLMWSYYDKTGNQAQTITFLKASLQLSDSLALKDRYLYAEGEDHAYQLLQDQYMIDLLQKNNTIKGMSLLFAAVVLLALCAIAILIRSNLRRHKKLLAEVQARNEAITRHEAQLEQLLAELDRKSKEKDRILRVVAHDLRSPVGGIKTMSGMLQGKDPRKQAEMIGFIRRSATDCLGLVNELLAGGFNDETVVLDREMFDLRQLVADSVQLMQFNAAEKHQLIEANLPGSGQPILADAAKLGRVLNNIMGNAIKFSPRDEKIIVTLTEQGKCYRITIRDHGIGIPACTQQEVFDVFTVTRRPGTQGEKSFGLGLSISRQIVEAHAGRIWFVSEEGKGTEFTIELPALP